MTFVEFDLKVTFSQSQKEKCATANWKSRDKQHTLPPSHRPDSIEWEMVAGAMQSISGCCRTCPERGSGETVSVGVVYLFVGCLCHVFDMLSEVIFFLFTRNDLLTSAKRKNI